MRRPRPAGSFLLFFFCSINNTRLQLVDLIFCATTIPGFLAVQEPKKISSKVVLLVVVVFTAVAPLVGVTRKILAVGTKFS
jgi:hypothetical protein